MPLAAWRKFENFNTPQYEIKPLGKQNAQVPQESPKCFAYIPTCEATDFKNESFNFKEQALNYTVTISLCKINSGTPILPINQVCSWRNRVEHLNARDLNEDRFRFVIAKDFLN